MKILVVGAGLAGATVARTIADTGIEVDVIERRGHTGGNAHDFINEFGIRVHQYGPHLFHTSSDASINFLSRFTDWQPYRHRVKAQLLDGRYVTLPVNKESLSIIGKDNVINTIYRPYTRKMWGIELEQVNPEIIQRVPIREDLNEDYFPNDKFQALPVKGYTAMIAKILNHPLITVTLNESYRKCLESKYSHIFNSMSIDEYFEYKYGMLPYRSIKFHHFSLPIPRILPAATINFTHNEPYTRVTEWKNLPGHGDHPSMSTVTIEEPCDFIENNFERYYPIKDLTGDNRRLYEKYKEITPEYMTFIGRCGLYAYLDMDQAVNSSLKIAVNFLKRRAIQGA
jgi:UDP-galactopyranose mutase